MIRKPICLCFGAVLSLSLFPTIGFSQKTTAKVHPLISLCGLSSQSASKILGQGKEAKRTFVSEGQSQTVTFMQYTLQDFKNVTPDFVPVNEDGNLDENGKTEVLGLCQAEFNSKISKWEDGFKLLGLSTANVIHQVESKISSSLVDEKGKPSQRIVFKNVKELDKRYCVIFDLTSTPSKIEIVYIKDSSFTTAALWEWLHSK